MSIYLNKLPCVAVKQTDKVFTITSFGQRQKLSISTELNTLHQQTHIAKSLADYKINVCCFGFIKYIVKI